MTPIDPIAYAEGSTDLVQDRLSGMKILVPGTRARVEDGARALIYALDAEIGRLDRQVAAVRRARSEVSIASAEFMSLTSQPAPWGQVRGATERFDRICIEAADLVFDTEPGVTHSLEREFDAEWSKNSHQGLGFL